MFNVPAKKLPLFKQPKEIFFVSVLIIIVILLLLNSVKYLSAELFDESGLTSREMPHPTTTVQRTLLNDSNYYRRSHGFYNFMVLILRDNIHFLCAGTVITSYHVLTAAHCLIDNENKRYQVKRISIKVAARNTVILDKMGLSLIMWFAHPEYDSSNRLNDVAVLELSKKLEQYSTVNLMPYSKKSEVNLLVAGKAECTVLGWHPDVTQTDHHLVEEKNVTLITWKDCATSSRNNVSNLLCIEFREQGRCKGDAGGPLLCKDSIQFGVATWDAGCKASDSKHLMMTRVDSVYDFIVKVTQRWRKFIPDDHSSKQQKKMRDAQNLESLAELRRQRSDLRKTTGSFFMEGEQSIEAKSSNQKAWTLTMPTALILIMLRNAWLN